MSFIFISPVGELFYMRKILVVSFTSGQKYTGGLQCSRRNLESIKALFGEENVVNYVIEPYQGVEKWRTKFKRVRDIFYGSMGGLDKEKTDEIMQLIIREGITDLFVDSSLLGLLAKRVKKRFPEIRITTFFHNFEKGFVQDYIRVNRDYFRLYWSVLTARNERAAIRSSDKIISLNRRDAEALEKCYGRKPDKLIPITLTGESPAEKLIPSDNREALFIGSYFFGNVQGIKWFCKEVLPRTNVHLTIVGASMNRILDEIEPTDQVTVLSDVPDLTPLYDAADFVVLPILSGSGMKVKTAESLMHGKYIVGTDEAFRGYDITAREGRRCNTAEEFVEAISSLSLPYKFNAPSRHLFEDKYSFESSMSAFAEVLDA